MNLDSNFLRPPLRLRKMVSCFWKPLSVLGEREEKGGKKKRKKINQGSMQTQKLN